MKEGAVMSRKFVSLSVVGFCVVAATATQANAQLCWRQCPPPPCYVQPVLPVQVICLPLVESVAYAADDCVERPGGEIWCGWFDVKNSDAAEHLIRGTLYVPVKNGLGIVVNYTAEAVAIPCNREVYNSLELGGRHKVECRTRKGKEWTDLGATKVRSIVSILESPVNPEFAPTSPAPREETYVPTLKAPTPPVERRIEEIVPSRRPTIPAPKLEAPELKQEVVPLQEPTNNIQIPEAEPQGYWDPSVNEEEAVKPPQKKRQGPIATKKFIPARR